MRRRSVLTSIGLGTAEASAGCVGPFADTDGSSSRIGWIGVANYDDSPHEFEVHVTRGGSAVHESEHSVRAKEDDIIPGEVLACTWGKTEGTYRIRSSVDDGEWVERSVGDAIDGPVDCVTARVVYDEFREGLQVLFAEDCDQVPTYDGGCAFANE